MRIALAAFVFALALAPVASGAKAPAPLVPLQQQAQMKSILSSFGFQDLEYIPTKAPAHYAYDANVVNSNENLITLADGGSYTYFTVQFFKSKLSSCDKGSQVKITVSGVTIFSSKGGAVWRCLKAPSGKVVKVGATGTGLSREDLGTVVASAKHA
jgi:hypothetical protein